MTRGRLLKIALVVLVVLDFLTPEPPMGFLNANAAARSAGLQSPFMVGPSDPSQMNANINTLVVAINAILSPLQGGNLINGAAPGSGATATNIIGFTPGVSGSSASIGLQPGSDANGSIQINPNGSGNVVLFAGAGNTGVLQIANATGWFPAKGAGIVPCPGGGAATLNAGSLLLPAGYQTVAGYEAHEDWLGRPYWVPGCR
jgi:hypothetical protein